MDAEFVLQSSGSLAEWEDFASAENGGAMVPLGDTNVVEIATEGGETIISTVEAVDGQLRLFFRQRTAEAP